MVIAGGTAMDESEDRLDAALSSVVRDLGRGVADEPTRLRAALVDQLGEHGRAMRAAVDVLAMAAEEGVGTELTDATDGLEVMQARLLARGLPQETADATLATWSRALQLDHDLTAEPLSATVLPLPTAEVPSAEAVPQAEAVPSAEAGAVEHGAPGPEGAGPADADRPRRRRAPLLVGVAAALVLALVGGAALALGGDDDPDLVEASVERETAERDETTTTAKKKARPTTTTSTTAAPATTAAPTTTTPAAPPQDDSPSDGPAPLAPGPATPATTVPPTTAAPANPAPRPPSPPPPAPLVPNNDSYYWTVQYFGSSPGEAQLTVLNNDSGPYNYVDFMSNPAHGNIRMAGTYIGYTPHHNGYFTDTFTYRLRNTSTGAVSATARVNVTVYCNTGVWCY
jgi:hypothetical protein